EADAVRKLISFLDKQFVQVIQLLYQIQGRLIVTGVGKSANIAQKIVATLNSTGTPSVFMHAADAVHGDLGIVQPQDAVMMLSKSGTTAELKTLLPFVRAMKVPVIAMVGNPNSYLAEQADYVLNVSVEREADPNGLAPTTSSTAALAMGDAIAVCLVHARNFTDKEFARYHPGGALGKRLYLRVADVFHADFPYVTPTATLQQVIMSITAGRMGATIVMQDNRLAGIITDGDLRRMLEKNQNLQSISAADLMNPNPRTIQLHQPALEALELLEAMKISQLVVMDVEKVVGILHFHDLLREGIR
ncbi:MAG: KpsF/GutQ family sugar-phosphate isomerase, partial [Bacteroidia bacterium]|nr:KpsF/GutQ family sugar-phosphate isomerase [Bacteroidia bacterium]